MITKHDIEHIIWSKKEKDFMKENFDKKYHTLSKNRDFTKLHTLIKREKNNLFRILSIKNSYQKTAYSIGDYNNIYDELKTIQKLRNDIDSRFLKVKTIIRQISV